MIEVAFDHPLTQHTVAARACVARALPPALISPTSEAFHALEFNFGQPFPEEGCRGRKVSVRAAKDGVVDAVMMTWDLALHGDVTYSTRHVYSGSGHEH